MRKRQDKGPQIEEPVHKWKKKTQGKKLFAIECRYVGPDRNYGTTDFLTRMWAEQREWHFHRRYTTEKQRDTALANFVQKKDNSHKFMSYWEYRKHE